MSPHVTPVRTYVLVFAALAVLTGVTAWVSGIDFGVLNTVVALSIAVVKALLVALWFMHLRTSPRLIWIFAGAGIVWFLFLVGLTMGDYDTRPDVPGWEATPEYGGP